MLVKLECLAYRMVKKNYDDMLSRFHLILEHNRRTDRRTDRFAISRSRVTMLTRDINHLGLWCCAMSWILRHEMTIVSAVQFLVTWSIKMQCEHYVNFCCIFRYCKTALYHCTIASYRKLSLHILCITAQYALNYIFSNGALYRYALTDRVLVALTGTSKP